MAIDLIMMLVLGVVLDILLTKFAVVVLGEYVMPASLVSMLIVFIAVARWNGYGLIISPLVSLGVVIGGCWLGGYYNAVYSFATDWQFYVSIVLGYLSFGVNILFYKRVGTKKIINETWKLLLLLLLDYVLFCGVQYLSYTLLVLGKDAETFVYSYVSSGTKEVVQLQIFVKPQSGFIYNLIALVILTVGTLIFRSQGIVCNVKQKFIDDKRNALLDEEDKKFSIEEASEEESSNELESASEEEVDNNSNE